MKRKEPLAQGKKLPNASEIGPLEPGLEGKRGLLT